MHVKEPSVTAQYEHYVHYEWSIRDLLHWQNYPSLQLFLMANFDHVNGPIDMRVWKGRRFENILKLDCDMR
jgi:hypothetical protein